MFWYYKRKINGDIMSMFDDLKNMVTGSKEVNTAPELASIPEEGTQAGDTSMEDTEAVTDRKLRIKITRDDEGCEWAVDNDVDVANAISRKITLMNNEFIAEVTDPKDADNLSKHEEEAKKYIEDKVIVGLDLQKNMENIMQSKSMYAIGVWYIGSKPKVDNLVNLDCKDIKPIVNLSTGKLGDGAGVGLDGDDSRDIAMIQPGLVASYNSLGGQITELKYYYYINNEIIVFSKNDRGKWKPVSDVMRSLRSIEIKKTIENTIEVVVRRFGPQIWITVGNKEHNLENCDLPASYRRDANGDLIDTATARQTFKTAKLTAVNNVIKRWVDADQLVQVAEYGVKGETFNPSSSLPQYQVYIDLFATKIRSGILGLDMSGRTDITSSLMQDKLAKDLKDLILKERSEHEDIINKQLTNRMLKVGGYPEDFITIKYKAIDRLDEKTDAEIELLKSDAIYNYTKGGFMELPEYLQKKWNLKIKDLLMPMGEMKDNIKQKIKGDEVDDKIKKNDRKNKATEKKTNPALRRRIDDMNRGR